MGSKSNKSERVPSSHPAVELFVGARTVVPEDRPLGDFSSRAAGGLVRFQILLARPCRSLDRRRWRTWRRLSTSTSTSSPISSTGSPASSAADSALPSITSSDSSTPSTGQYVSPFWLVFSNTPLCVVSSNTFPSKCQSWWISLKALSELDRMQHLAVELEICFSFFFSTFACLSDQSRIEDSSVVVSVPPFDS